MLPLILAAAKSPDHAPPPGWASSWRGRTVAKLISHRCAGGNGPKRLDVVCRVGCLRLSAGKHWKGTRMQKLLIAAGLLLFAPGAEAQRRSDDGLSALGIKMVGPMSPRELAATKTRVAAELARSGTAAFFEDVSDENSGKARHRPSGLTCPLGKKGQRVLSATADSATCETRGDGAVYKTKVERAPAGASLDSVAAAVLSEAQREPGYARAGGLMIEARAKPGSNTPEYRTLQYLSRVDGRERLSRVQIGIVRGWILTERRETKKNAQPSMMADLLSAATFGLSMRED